MATFTAQADGATHVVDADTAALVANNLCQYWADAKAALNIISPILTGPWAAIYRAAIAVIIKVGDAACPGN